MDMPSNGEFRLLSGNGTYQIVGDLVLDAAANDVLDLRITKSTDGGTTWPTEITLIRVAPLGDPLEIKVRGYNLSLRKREARDIKVAIEA